MLSLAALEATIEVGTTLSPDLAGELLAGQLSILIRSPALESGFALAVLGDPVFVSDFDVGGLCDWSNFACPSDADVCTDDLCAPATGACSYVPNTAPCTLPNATASCSAGHCGIDSCNSGYSNCDDNTPNGCEVAHGAVSGSCGAGTNLGTYDGDKKCGFPSCADNLSWDLFATQTGRTSKWFRARVREASSACSADIEHRIRLAVPANINYDLYVYRSCDTIAGSSTASGLGVDEEVIVSETENFSADDSFDYYIRVEYVAGASCFDWSLTVEGHLCS